MANAIPVNSTKAPKAAKAEAPVAAVDPRRPSPEAETVPGKPKLVTQLPGGTVCEDY